MTRISRAMEYEPECVVENVGDAVGITSHRVQKDLERFKSFIESRGDASGEWRGEVHGGRRVPARGDGRMR